MLRKSRAAAIAVLAIGLLACGGNNSAVTAPGDSSGGSTGSPIAGGSSSGTRDPSPGGNFISSFPLDRITSGGVPKDGIPALTDPPFVSPGAGGSFYLSEDDVVLGADFGQNDHLFRSKVSRPSERSDAGCGMIVKWQL